MRDLPRSLYFYEDVLGGRLKARWRDGAYLELGSLWLCLSVDALKSAEPAPHYTHAALSVAQHEFAATVQRLRAAQVLSWKDNRSEGDSFYFLDPDDHKLELHVGDLHTRLAQCRLQPYADMTFFD